VYRAHDTKLNRDVALKVVPELVALDPDHLSRVTREAQLLASLNHRNIATIYGLDTFEGVQVLVLELVDGPTLAERIARGPLPVADVLLIARQVVEALDAAHQQGIVHRDLKPANIKLAAKDTVKVLDFGLAKVGSQVPQLEIGPAIQSAGNSGAASGLVVGSPAYMSPEQARGGPVDTRTDIWAFGCLLYEMLTGRRAFSGQAVEDVIAGSGPLAGLGAPPRRPRRDSHAGSSLSREGSGASPSDNR
jgi:serine/threonine-protein kinase